MENFLIPEELQALINQYLTDGVLTDKERAVILRKAEGMGLDRDEIDLYLDAEVQKIDQETDAAMRRQKGKQCPYCGGSVPQLTEKCPHCGESITAEVSNELQEIFNNLEDALIDMKAGKDISRNKANVARYVRKAKMYFGNNPKVQKLLSEIETETIETENRVKADARRNALLQFIIRNKKYFIGLIIVLFAFFYIQSYMGKADRVRQEYEQQYEIDKPKIDEQFETLCKKIEELDAPNKSNYKEMTNKLLKIVWVDVSKNERISNKFTGETTYIENEYEQTKKEIYVKMKRAYAEQLEDIYNSVGDENKPDELRYKNLYLDK